MCLQLGSLSATPGALELLTPADTWHMLSRHSRHDWGEVDAEDKAANDRAVRNGERVLSAYTVRERKFWVITEADRASTTILLPEEY
jgi:hypothetical protein